MESTSVTSTGPVSTDSAPMTGGRHRPPSPGSGLIGWALCSPAVAFLGLFVVVPVLLVTVLTFFSWNPLTQSIDAVGFGNYERTLGSPEFRQATVNTLVYTAVTVPTTIALGLVIAVGIGGVRRGAGLWRTLFFLPVASTLAAMSVVWRWMFYPETGVVDATIGRLTGLHAWLQSESLALLGVAAVGIWQALGTAVLIYLAGLAGVPRHLHDAAALDGAGPWTRFWHVTWPALGPATVLVLVIVTRDAFRVFDQVLVMTEGGPLGATTTLPYLMWERGVFFNDVGGGAVVNLVILLVVLVFVGVQLRTFGRRLNMAGART